MAIMLISSVYVLSSPVDALADTVSYTVTFHYTRSDQNYAGYRIKAYTVSNSTGSDTVTFEVNGSEGVFSYRFNRDVDNDDDIMFIVQTADRSETEIQDSVSLDNNAEAMDIFINGDTKEVTFSSASASTDTLASVDTPSSDGPVDSSTIYQEDDKTKDYSVGILQAIIFDVVLFAIIGGASYVLLSKEKKAKV